MRVLHTTLVYYFFCEIKIKNLTLEFVDIFIVKQTRKLGPYILISIK